MEIVIPGRSFTSFATIPSPETAPAANAERLTAKAANVFYVGRYAEALSLLDQALALDSRSPRSHTVRALTLAQLGRPDEGLAAAREALRRDPTFANAYCASALCLHRLGRRADALAAYEQALGISPDDPRVLYNYGCFWAETGDEENCRKYLTEAFKHVDYEAIDHSRDDPDLARYVNTDWFRDLLAAAKKGRRAANGLR